MTFPKKTERSQYLQTMPNIFDRAKAPVKRLLGLTSTSDSDLRKPLYQPQEDENSLQEIIIDNPLLAESCKNQKEGKTPIPGGDIDLITFNSLPPPKSLKGLTPENFLKAPIHDQISAINCNNDIDIEQAKACCLAAKNHYGAKMNPSLRAWIGFFEKKYPL